MPECFAIFEGGGARGLAHVGALKRAEECGLQFVGVAGASAGAIVATLVAAGFSADKIFDPDPEKRSLFRDLNWIDLLGADRWESFRALKAAAIEILPSSGAPGIGACWRAWRFHKRWRTAIIEAAGQRGAFGTAELERWMNAVLCEKLGVGTREVDFELLYARRPVPLKLVAVDIDHQELVTYSYRKSRTTSVAKAVAASASIPFVFSPTVVDRRPMVDGGLMANFPAWLFEYERTLFPPSLRTYGFTIIDPAPTDARRLPVEAFFEYAKVVARTAVFGGQALMNESVELLETVPIRTSIPTLGFDATDETKLETYREGYASAEAYFGREGVIDDLKVTFALQDLCGRLQQMVALPKANFRANVLLPVQDDLLRVVYTFNMHNDTDDRLLLNTAQAGAGRAMATRKAVVTDVRLLRDGKMVEGLDKYSSALVRPDLVSIYSVPIFRTENEWKDFRALRTPPRAVLSFDCNEDILNAFNRSDIQDLLTEAAVWLGRLFRGETS